MTITLADVYAAPHHTRLRRTVQALARRYFRHDPDHGLSAAFEHLAYTPMDPTRPATHQVIRHATRAMWVAVMIERRRAKINLPMTDKTPTPTVDWAPDVRLRMRAVLAGLSPRERQIVSLAADGLTGREIAARLGLTPGRVSQIRSAIRARV